MNTNPLNGIVFCDSKVGYGKKVVLQGVDFKLEPGQIVTLIGPNGCGKSTLLKTLTGGLKQLGGCIYLDGKEIAKESPSDLSKELAIVMTNRIRPELMTCRELVATGRYPYTGRLGILGEKDWQKVEEAMRMTNAIEVAEENYLDLSDGQRQRVLLARAIAQDTPYLVLDEPTSYLDMHYKLDLLKTIRRLAKDEGKAILMSLHELDLARSISDSIVCVNDGKIIKVGRPDEIYQGNFLQNLFGVKEEEFDPETGVMRLI